MTILTFPGELSVQIGLNIKKKSSRDFTFIAGYSNGYLHYAPTAEQFKGEDYEDTIVFSHPSGRKSMKQGYWK